MSDPHTDDAEAREELDLDRVAADFDRIEAALGDLDGAPSISHEDPGGQ